MSNDQPKDNKKNSKVEQALAELTADLQRVQADFINYRNRAEDDRQRMIDGAKAATIMKLLPIIDDIERAVSHIPEELFENNWVKGVAALPKNLEKGLLDLGIKRISSLSEEFDPNIHEAVSVEEGNGAHEVVIEELRAGYVQNGHVIRPAMVRVGHQDLPGKKDPNTEAVEDISESLDQEPGESMSKGD